MSHIDRVVPFSCTLLLSCLNGGNPVSVLHQKWGCSFWASPYLPFISYGNYSPSTTAVNLCTLTTVSVAESSSHFPRLFTNHNVIFLNQMQVMKHQNLCQLCILLHEPVSLLALGFDNVDQAIQSCSRLWLLCCQCACIFLRCPCGDLRIECENSCGITTSL